MLERMRGLALLGSLLLLALAEGCWGSSRQSCDDPCPFIEVGGTVLDGSRAQYSVGAAPRDVPVRIPIAGGSELPGCVGPVGPFSDSHASTSMHVTCFDNAKNGPFVDGSLNLGDLRTLAVGTTTKAGKDVAAKFVLSQGCAAQPCPSCVGDLDDAVVTITVEEASGGPTDTTTLVTSDFRRVVRVQLTPSATTGAGWKGELCAHAVPTTFDVKIEQTKYSYVDHADNKCTCDD